MGSSKAKFEERLGLEEWFNSQGWTPHAFQRATWKAYRSGAEGLVQAPTGMGKTYSLLGAAVAEAVLDDRPRKGLQVIWIAPIRSLSKEIEQSAQRLIQGAGLDWRVGVRTGDTTSAERAKQNRNLPQVLITTPESLHLLLARKDHEAQFRTCKLLAVDEWHALIGTKRGVQVELAASRIRKISNHCRTWGLTATIGNLEQALEVLCPSGQGMLIRSDATKETVVQSLMPLSFERLAWAGFLGLPLLGQVMGVIQSHSTTLVFTNTRAQAEIWYHRLLDAQPDLAGILALHHGSLAKDARIWIEDALGEGRLKAVVCTSSLDLGVDFPPVEAVIQIGSPKGVARFLQRAGRSGHHPGGKSRIYFAPTHGLELMEGAALREAIESNEIESRRPVIRAFDVLVQWLCTRALGGGFTPAELLAEVLNTHAFQTIDEAEWNACLGFVRNGGETLAAYEEYRRVDVIEGRWVILDPRVARRHRMSIGTIVSDPMVAVRLKRHGVVGHVESNFIERLQPGDVFWFAGRQLEFVRLEGSTAEVIRARKPSHRVPVWSGGRLPLSTELGHALRKQLDLLAKDKNQHPELARLQPLMSIQAELSKIPKLNELLIELFEDEDGHHVCIFPFEGRAVHEGLAMLISHRLTRSSRQTIAFACNDYGLELLSDQPIVKHQKELREALSLNRLEDDVLASLNASQVSRRRFKEIAVISGLQFQPKDGTNARHLRTHSGLLFDVFSDHDPDHILFRQAIEEVLADQLEIAAMQAALERCDASSWCWETPSNYTPLSFPLVVDRLREVLSSEELESRIQRMVIKA